jgi:hypothetical protein
MGAGAATMLARSLLLLATANALALWAPGATPTHHSPESALALVAEQIEALKGQYPQLEEFSAQRNAHRATLRISYAYRTHKAKHHGGWSAGVPNPDEDGVWFFIDLHDPSSKLQIHTQPMMGHPQCLGRMRVGFLILEGRETVSMERATWQILRKNGVIECPADRFAR